MNINLQSSLSSSYFAYGQFDDSFCVFVQIEKNKFKSHSIFVICFVYIVNKDLFYSFICFIYEIIKNLSNPFKDLLEGIQCKEFNFKLNAHPFNTFSRNFTHLFILIHN